MDQPDPTESTWYLPDTGINRRKLPPEERVKLLESAITLPAGVFTLEELEQLWSGKEVTKTFQVDTSQWSCIRCSGA